MVVSVVSKMLCVMVLPVLVLLPLQLLVFASFVQMLPHPDSQQYLSAVVEILLGGLDETEPIDITHVALSVGPQQIKSAHGLLRKGRDKERSRTHPCTPSKKREITEDVQCLASYIYHHQSISY